MDRLAATFERTRLPTVLFVLLASVLAVVGVTRLRVDDVPRELFASDDDGFALLLQLYEDFGADDNDLLLLCESEDWFAPGRFEVVSELVARARAVSGVEAVVWAGSVPVFDGGLFPRPLETLVRADAERARTLAHEHSLIERRLVSSDDRALLVVTRIERTRLSIDQLQPVVDELRALAAEFDQREDLRVRVTGIPPIRADIFHVVRAEQVRFLLLGGVLCALTALCLFRSVGAVLCTTVPPLVGALWAYGLLGFLGVELDILSGILSMLVIVIALTDSVHLMIDVRLSRARGLGRVAAGGDAIRHLGLPCALTSLTTAVGFGSLTLAGVPAIRAFGGMAAASVVAAFLAVVSLMPLMTTWFGDVGRPKVRTTSTTLGARRVIDLVVRRARGVALGGLVVTLGLVVLAARVETENRLTEALPRDEAYQALVACERAFGGVLPSYVLVEWDGALGVDDPQVMGAVGAVSAAVEALGAVGRPLSYLDLVDAVPNGRNRPSAALALFPDALKRPLLRADLSQALVVAPMPDEGSDVLLPLFAELDAELDRLADEFPSASFRLTGTDYVARKNVNRMIDDLARSLGFAVLVIFGVIALEFRSLRIGLISLLPNLFPLALVGGTLELIGQPLQMASAVLFTVLLGLAVDDTIHFLSRLRRERRAALAAGRDPDDRLPMERTFLAVGRAIVVTTIVLTVGFATVGLSSVPTNRVFAALACLGLAGALVGDLLLLPALLSVRRRQ